MHRHPVSPTGVLLLVFLTCSKSAKWLIIMSCSKLAKWLVDLGLRLVGLNYYLDVSLCKFKISRPN